MSTSSIESKVVEMKFDNKDFEANVSSTLSTLDKLKSKLEFKGATSGLDSIAKASSRIDFSGMTDGLDYAEVKFSALQVAGITAIQNITNSLMSLGTQLVNTFAIQPVSSGFAEYELKMGSVQTIMASTGASIEEINGYLDELNKYSDETIYSFSDMTNNIGKFTNAGVGLEDAVKAIQGISNEAAVSGANANEASRAMYNFAQALSAGYVKLIDWKSIENANMATKEFKQELINTAAELGTLEQQADGTYKVLTTSATGSTMDEAITSVSNFNDSLQYQWMTTDVLTTTLGRYADETTAIGQKAFAAAKDVKTFSMMMDTLMESAGSGWATTFELIWGNFTEAKAFWTDLTNELQPFIDMMNNSRNDFLEDLMQGADATAWTQITEMITNAGISVEKLQEGVVAAGDASGLATQEIIDSAGSMEAAFKSGKLSANLLTEGLGQLANGVGDLGETSKKSASELKETLSASNDLLDSVTKLSFGSAQSGADIWKQISEHIEYSGVSIDRFQKSVVACGDAAGIETMKVIEEAGGLKEAFTSGKLEATLITTALSDMADNAEDLTAEQRTSLGLLQNELINTDTWKEHLADLTGREYFTQSILNTVTAIKNIVSTIGTAWNEAFANTDGVSYFHNVLKGVYTLTDTFLKWTTERADELKRTFKGLFSIVQLFTSSIGTVASFLAKSFGKALNLASFDLLDLTAALGDGISAFVEWVQKESLLSDALNFFSSVILGVLDTLLKFKDYVLDTLEAIGAFTAVKNIFNGAASAIQKVASGSKSLRDIVKNLATYITQTVSSVKDWVSKNELLQAALKLLRETIAKLKEEITDWFNSVKDFITGIDFNSMAESAKTALSSLGWSFVNAGEQAIESRKTFLEVCADIAKAIGEGISGAIQSFNIWKILDEFVNGFKEFVSSIQSLFSGLVKGASDTANDVTTFISKINWGPLITIAGAVGIAYTMNQIAKSFASISSAVEKVLNPLNVFSGLVNEAKNTLKSFQNVLKAAKFTTYAAGLVEVAIAIGILAASVVAIGNLDPDRMNQGLAGLAGVIGGMALIIVLISAMGEMKTAQVSLANAAVFMGAIAVFVGACAAVTVVLGRLDESTLTKGLTSLGIIIALLCALVAAVAKIDTKTGAATFAAMGGMSVALGAAMLLLAAAIKNIGELDEDVLIQGRTTIGIFALFLAALVAMSAKGDAAAIGAIASLAIAIGAAMILLAAAIKIIGTMEPGPLTQGIIVIGVFSAFLAAIIAAVNRNGSAVVKLGGTILAITVAIGLLIGVCKLAEGLSKEAFVKGIAVVGVFGSMLTAFAKVLGSGSKEKQVMKGAASILAMSIALGALVAVCYLCSILDAESLTKGLIAVGVLGSIVAVMVRQLRGATEASKSIMMLAVVMSVLVVCVAVLGSMDTSALAQGIIAVSLLMVVFSVLLRALSTLKDMKLGTAAGSLAILVVVLAGIAGVLAMMSALNVQNAMQNATALSEVLLAMAAACLALDRVKEVGKSAIVAIASLTVISAGIGLVLAEMSALNTQNALVNATALSEVLLAMSAACLILSKANEVSKSALKAMTVMTVVAAAAAAMLGVMSAANVQSAIPNATALSVLVAALAASCLILSNAEEVSGSALGAFAVISLLLYAIAPVLIWLSSSNIQGAIPNAIALSTLVIALSAACVLLELAGLGGTAALYGCAALAALIVGGAGIMAIIGGLNGLMNGGLGTAVNDAIPLLCDLGSGLGGMVGNFVGGALEGLSSHLPAIGENLSAFLVNLNPFVEMAKQLSGVDMSGISNLANAILAMAEAELLNGINSIVDFFTGNSIESTLVQYANAIKSFCEVMADCDVSGALKGSIVAPMIAQVLEALPAEGGLKGLIFGDQSNTMANLASNLKTFGQAISDFSGSLADVKLDAVQNGVEAAKAVAEIMQLDLPKEGGFLDKIFGNQSTTISNLSGNLQNLGDAAAAFANATTGIKTDGISSAVDVIKQISEIMTGDAKSALESTMDTSGFATHCSRLATGAKMFGSTVAGIDFSGVSSGVESLRTICDFITEKLSGEFSAAGVEGFKAATDVLATVQVSAIAQQFSNGAGQLTQAGMDLMAGLASGLTAGGQVCTSAASGVTTLIQNGVSGVAGNFVQPGSDFMTNLATGISGSSSAPTGAVTSVVSQIVTMGETAAAQFQQVGTEAMRCLAQGISSNVGVARSAAENAISTVCSGLSGYSAFYDTGRWCMQGFANGMRDNKYIATQAASAAATEAKEAADKAVGVASPSKEFKKTGYWCVVGLANGFRDYSNIAANAGASLAETVMDSTSDSLDLLSAINDTNSSLATFKPVVDYSSMNSYGKTLDLSASVGNIITQPMRNSMDAITDAQKAINASNASVTQAINDLRTDMGSYSEAIANSETSMYIDGKKLASTIAKPINQQLGLLQRRGY